MCESCLILHVWEPLTDEDTSLKPWYRSTWDTSRLVSISRPLITHLRANIRHITLDTLLHAQVTRARRRAHRVTHQICLQPGRGRQHRRWLSRKIARALLPHRRPRNHVAARRWSLRSARCGEQRAASIVRLLAVSCVGYTLWLVAAAYCRETPGHRVRVQTSLMTRCSPASDARLRHIQVAHLQSVCLTTVLVFGWPRVPVPIPWIAARIQASVICHCSSLNAT
jgi:hypothetical protein